MKQDRMEQLLRAAAPAQFDAGFDERVMRRLASMATPHWSATLERQFVRFAPLAAAAVIALAFMNARNTGDRDFVDAALGLPEVSLAAAYAQAFGGEP
jgi:hypothetical protein